MLLVTYIKKFCRYAHANITILTSFILFCRASMNVALTDHLTFVSIFLRLKVCIKHVEHLPVCITRFYDVLQKCTRFAKMMIHDEHPSHDTFAKQNTMDVYVVMSPMMYTKI